jgi:hypothetical protein
MDDDLPNFKIPHAEKIDWMVETNGWAMETVAAGSFTTAEGAPFPAFTYSINFPALLGIPEVVACGLTPVACRGIFDMVVDVCRQGAQIEPDVALLGLFDGEQRAKFVAVDLDRYGALFATATAWHRGNPYGVWQLLWPDRNGFLPDEVGFDQRLQFAQPVLA